MHPQPIMHPQIIKHSKTKTALTHVKAARKQAECFSAPLPTAHNAAELLEQALGEIKNCVEALSLAEETFVNQNAAFSACLLSLQEERQQYQSLLEAVSDAILITDSTGLIRQANSAAARLLGLTTQYLIGGQLAKLFLDGEFADLQNVMVLEAEVQEHRLRISASGATITVSATWSPVVVGTLMVDGRGQHHGLRLILRRVEEK